MSKIASGATAGVPYLISLSMVVRISPDPHLAVVVGVVQVEVDLGEQATAHATARDAEVQLGRCPEADIELQFGNVVALRIQVADVQAVEQQLRIVEVAGRELGDAEGVVAERGGTEDGAEFGVDGYTQGAEDRRRR